jgi:hypothetical protein
VDHGAHRTVENGDAAGEKFLKRGGAGGAGCSGHAGESMKTSVMMQAAVSPWRPIEDLLLDLPMIGDWAIGA